MANLFEEMLSSIGAAIDDVREKVVEEPWFGRAVTDGPSPPESAAASPTVTTTEESPQIVSMFDRQLDTIISAPPDPDIQPHGQAVDR